MSKPLEQYALIGDCHGAGLVALDGSIDWLCLPRFDANACFAALLGDDRHGHWKVAPVDPEAKAVRTYLQDTLMVETLFETATGEVVVTDFMPPYECYCRVVRKVEVVLGEVEMECRARFRPDYGVLRPWIRRVKNGCAAVSGSEMYRLTSDREIEAKEGDLLSHFTLREGDTAYFHLRVEEAHDPFDEDFEVNPDTLLRETSDWWQAWVNQGNLPELHREELVRSLITLKALSYLPSGGIIAAPTTSLPEVLGGVRNWDYRYCWIRDASLLLKSFVRTGFIEEARQWHDFVLRAMAGDPGQAQIMYGVTGERRFDEIELDWLPGYENSGPVHIGNGARTQVQLDIYGEMMASYYIARKEGLPTDPEEWGFLLTIMEYVGKVWQDEDEGIWEVRGKSAHFVYSKFMCWAACHYGILAAREFGEEAPLDEWVDLMRRIHAEICERGFDKERNAFMQSYESPHLDASLLRMVIDGFLPPDDPRILGTIEAVERELIHGGLVYRYYPSEEVDGLPGEEGAFLMCSYWLADVYLLLGRRGEAITLYERVLGLANDVGLLAEEYDIHTRRMVGNFPQGLSHTGLVVTALGLADIRVRC
ncbi:MAG: glycoside hydrolase family 15 protein [Akkermansiaceae bacterium]